MIGYRITERGKAIIEKATQGFTEVSEEELALANLLCSLALETEYFTYDPREPEERAEPLQVASLERHNYIERSLVPETEFILRRATLRRRFPRLFEEDDDA